MYSGLNVYVYSKIIWSFQTLSLEISRDKLESQISFTFKVFLKCNNFVQIAYRVGFESSYQPWVYIKPSLWIKIKHSSMCLMNIELNLNYLIILLWTHENRSYINIHIQLWYSCLYKTLINQWAGKVTTKALLKGNYKGPAELIDHRYWMQTCIVYMYMHVVPLWV